MAYRCPRPDETLAEIRAALARLRGDTEPQPEEPKYVLRYTEENIGGVTVIVGLVEPASDGRGST